jgi:hypothetical protein
MGGWWPNYKFISLIFVRTRKQQRNHLLPRLHLQHPPPRLRSRLLLHTILAAQSRASNLWRNERCCACDHLAFCGLCRSLDVVAALLPPSRMDPRHERRRVQCHVSSFLLYKYFLICIFLYTLCEWFIFDEYRYLIALIVAGELLVASFLDSFSTGYYPYVLPLFLPPPSLPKMAITYVFSQIRCPG